MTQCSMSVVSLEERQMMKRAETEGISLREEVRHVEAPR